MQGEQQIHESDEIRNVLTVALQLTQANIPFERQLELLLKHVVSISWLALESKGAVLVVDADQSTLVMKANYNLPPALLVECARVPFGRCLCGRAAALAETQFADHVDERHENGYAGMSPHGHYCVPILSRGTVLGVVNLYVSQGHSRRERDEQFLDAFAAVLAGIIERRRAEENLKNTLMQLQVALRGTVEAMGLAVEAKDPYTAGHQRRVAELAHAMAAEMGLPHSQQEGVRMASVIHDLGKLSVPAEILSCPRRLNDAEMAIVRMHPRLGYDILKTIEFPWPIADIVLQHHERMDGSGYPSGLAGTQILLEARILGVADVVEAMASHRPYRPALGMSKALGEISCNRGVLYDPQAADACLSLLAKKGFTCGWA